MDKKKYLEMCQRVAVIPAGVLGLRDVPPELWVIYGGIKYYPIERVATFDQEGNLVIRARLHDLKANSVTECPLEKVEEYKNEKN